MIGIVDLCGCPPVSIRTYAHPTGSTSMTMWCGKEKVSEYCTTVVGPLFNKLPLLDQWQLQHHHGYSSSSTINSAGAAASISSAPLRAPFDSSLTCPVDLAMSTRIITNSAPRFGDPSGGVWVYFFFFLSPPFWSLLWFFPSQEADLDPCPIDRYVKWVVARHKGCGNHYPRL